MTPRRAKRALWRSAVRCCRSATRAGWCRSPKRWPRAASSWCRPAARRARCAEAGLPVTRRRRGDRLSGNARRPGEDAAPGGPWRPPGAARPAGAPGGNGRARHRADRSRRREPLSVRGRPSRRRRSRGVRREHRYRRPGHDPRRRQEPRRRRRGRRPRPTTTRCSAEIAASRRRPRWTTAQQLARKAYAHTAAYDAAIAIWFARAIGGSTFPATLVSRRHAGETSATARTRTSGRPSTAPASPGPASRRRGSSRARSCPTTTLTTPTRPMSCVAEFDRAGGRDHQARQPVRCRDRHDAARGLPQALACDAV